MKLAPEQSRKLLRERGVWVTEACDRCGQLLGSVRWTKRAEPGEWCSRECRDGKAESQAHEVRIARKAGRPKLNLSESSRLARRKKQIREAVSRFRSNVIKNWQQPIETAEFTGAKIEAHVPHAYNARCEAQIASNAKNAGNGGLGARSRDF